MSERIEEVLREWFGEGDEPDEATQKRWWTKDPENDAYLRDTYGEDIDRAVRGDLDDWAKTPRGALALVILLDQWTRNTFRGTGEMYCGDERAVRVVKSAIDAGFDAELSPQMRQFLYMPLMHSEDVDTQHRCVEEFERLHAETGLDTRGYAVQHRDIVVRFGRFPHRNALLGRESTDEEEAFLKEPGSSF